MGGSEFLGFRLSGMNGFGELWIRYCLLYGVIKLGLSKSLENWDWCELFGRKYLLRDLYCWVNFFLCI